MRKIKVSLNKLYLIFAYAFILLAAYILLDNLARSEYSYFLLALVSLILLMLIVDGIYLKSISVSLLSPVGFYILILNLFHFGQAILTSFDPNYISQSTNFVRNESRLIKSTLTFAFFACELIIFFILLFYSEKDKNDYIESEIKFDDATIRRIGVIIFCITAPCRYIYDVSRIIIMQRTGNYLETFNTSFSGVFTQFADFYLIAVILILVSLRENIIKARAFVIFVMAEFALAMLSGGRMYGVISIYIILFVYFGCVETFSFKQYITMFVLAVLGLQFLSIISNTRLNGISVQSIKQYTSSSRNNIFVNILDEFGATIFTVRETIAEVPSMIPFQKGLSYLKALAFVGINIGGILDKINLEVRYTQILHKPYSYGGSIIGEMYYNFGYLSLLLTPLIGLLIGKIIKSFTNAVKNEKWVKVALFTMPMYYCITWVRDFFSALVRGSIWGAILVLIVYKIDKLLKR